jgi:hypothetical protein
MGNTHSGKPRKSLEKPRFLGIPGKILILVYHLDENKIAPGTWEQSGGVRGNLSRIML